MKKILCLLVSALALIGIGVKFSFADLPQQTKIENISMSTPFFLEASPGMHQNGQNLVADHDSHDSHYSHDSHDSHASHDSHYSGY